MMNSEPTEKLRAIVERQKPDGSALSSCRICWHGYRCLMHLPKQWIEQGSWLRCRWNSISQSHHGQFYIQRLTLRNVSSYRPMYKTISSRIYLPTGQFMTMNTDILIRYRGREDYPNPVLMRCEPSRYPRCQSSQMNLWIVEHPPVFHARFWE